MALATGSARAGDLAADGLANPVLRRAWCLFLSLTDRPPLNTLIDVVRAKAIRYLRFLDQTSIARTKGEMDRRAVATPSPNMAMPVTRR